MKINIFSRLSKREKAIFYIVVAIIVAFFFDRGVLQPVMDKLSQLNKEILVQEKKLQRSAYILSQEKSIIKEYRKITQHLKQEQSDEKEIAGLLSEIEKLASKCSVFLSNIKPGPTEEVKPYKRYTVEIEVKSEIRYLIDFIYQLEKSQRMLRVKEFYLTPTKKDSPILKGHLVITQLLITPDDYS